MSKTILIHGFAIGLTSPIFRSGFGVEAGFFAWRKQITTGEAVIFPWGIFRRVNFFQLINPLFLLNHYEDEKFLAQANETFERLKIFLEQTQPTKIICHSMGCFLLNEYCKKNLLPKSVKVVILLQSDLSSQDQINFSLKNLSVYNFYCPWDPTLLVSAIYNRVWRSGLSSLKTQDVKNIFYPLFRPINLHMNSFKDYKLAKHIDSLE